MWVAIGLTVLLLLLVLRAVAAIAYSAGYIRAQDDSTEPPPEL